VFSECFHQSKYKPEESYSIDFVMSRKFNVLWGKEWSDILYLFTVCFWQYVCLSSLLCWMELVTG